MDKRMPWWGYLIWVLVLGGPLAIGAYYKGWYGVRDAIQCTWFGSCVIEVAEGVWCRVPEARHDEARSLGRTAADTTRPEPERRRAMEQLDRLIVNNECFVRSKVKKED